MKVPIPACTAVVLCGLLSSFVQAETTVNGYSSLIREVIVQPIICKKSNGETALFLGDEETESYIKAQINRIWIQSGIRVVWSDPTYFVNDFCYDGSPGNYYQGVHRPPDDHLIEIVDYEGFHMLHPDPTVVNMFFVRIVPGSSLLSPYTAAGLAFVDSNGLTMTVGAELLNFTEGRDAVASVISHELGHNLGLGHMGGDDNLMAPAALTERLIDAQTSVVFTNDAGWNGVDGWDMLKVLTGQPNFVAWSLHNTSTASIHGDDDDDGLSNILEYMLGLEVDEPDLSAVPGPVLSVDGLQVTCPKQANALADGLRYGFEVSKDGKAWMNAGTVGSGSTLVADNDEVVIARLDAGTGGGIMRFKADIPQYFMVPVAGGSVSLSPPGEDEDEEVEIEAGQRTCSSPVCCQRTVVPGLRAKLAAK
ncbi:MAG: hypothetical protein AAGA58_01740 [Verrucomicrobiota bacterium]